MGKQFFTIPRWQNVCIWPEPTECSGPPPKKAIKKHRILCADPRKCPKSNRKWATVESVALRDRRTPPPMNNSFSCYANHRITSECMSIGRSHIEIENGIWNSVQTRTPHERLQFPSSLWCASLLLFTNKYYAIEHRWAQMCSSTTCIVCVCVCAQPISYN